MSSARKAPSPTVVIFGQQEHGGRLHARCRRRRRGPGASTGVTRLAYSGNSSVRAESSSRSVAHTCQPMRLRTGHGALPDPQAEQPDGDDRQEGERAEADGGGERDDEESPHGRIAERLRCRARHDADHHDAGQRRDEGQARHGDAS